MGRAGDLGGCVRGAGTELSRCERLRAELGCEPDELVGESPAHEAMLEDLALVARRRARVLLVGPTGVGKSTVARALHRASSARGPFVSCNAAALPASLAESMLFGHAEGSFTSAVRDQPGLLREADGGTLLLDEVGDLDVSVQAKLLTFLDSGEARGIGLPSRRLDVRLVCATHRDTSALRLDLFERLAQFVLAVPPLSRRPGDIPLLAEASLRRIAQREALEPLRLAPDAEARLLAQLWPGNVRQLERALLAADIRARASGARRIRAEHLCRGAALPGGVRWEERLAAFRGALLAEALEASRGSVPEAAELLGIGRSTLYSWMGRADAAGPTLYDP